MLAREEHDALADHLVGRAEELGSLDRVLAELDRGSAVAIELVGEPGIGKTRLLEELAARAEERGHLVLLGSAAELERNLPFAVFVDALDEYVEGLDAQWLARLDDDVAAELAHVLPSPSALAGDHLLALEHERYRSHRAVRKLLERAHRAAALTRIELAALTAAEAREFLGETVDVADATVLIEESGGNPFYLEQLARSLNRRGGTTAGPEITLSGIEIPSAVAAALSES